ncbi:ABC transporter ATP-binding protein [Phytoactinopolyspora alkaliphila]|uniref:ABC transporter ATP-binding protein n=2 Tax=Phytoactinopolyspora alkaliphila TaxID=1783498 RepID=A0A6N9YHF1_9ACTN|nr:ABC transporter ATP-binding protein [Phytoactinopolyspora alkaliphila]
MTTPEQSAERPLMEIRDLKVHYELRGSALARLVGGEGETVKAVDGVNVALRKGEVLGLVGESGSGKTTLGRALLGLVRPTSGHITYGDLDLARMPQRQLRSVRRRLQMVFQDPHAALNPSMDLATAIGHPLRIHKLVKSKAEARERVRETLERVGLTPADQFLDKLPAELSGGQKQRAVIARAIICGPELLVADEPISMLDMSVRAKILELMLELGRDLDLTYVYITHDLATAKFFCDRVAIMYLGRVVEIGPTEEIFADPKHPYTKALLRAVPDLDPERKVPRDLPRGEIPDAAAPPHGCSFHPRCPFAFEPCGWEARDLRAMFERRWIRLGEDALAREEPLVGELTEVDAHEEMVRVRAGGRAAELTALLEEARADEPDDPLWKGVERIESDGGAVVVRFRPGIDPGLLRVNAVDVACHLHDPNLSHDH